MTSDVVNLSFNLYLYIFIGDCCPFWYYLAADPEKPVGDEEAMAAVTSVADAPELVNATPSSKSTAGSKGSKQTKKSKKSEKDGAESEKAERAKSSTKPQVHAWSRV